MIIPGKNYQLSGNRRDRVDPWGCSHAKHPHIFPLPRIFPKTQTINLDNLG